MSDDGVLEQEGRYRIRLIPDEDPMEPGDDSQSPLLRFDHRSWGYHAEHIDGSSRPKGDDTRIEEAARRWGPPSGDNFALLEKYLKAFHGVTQVEYWYSGSYWYVTYDSRAWREWCGASEGGASLDDYRAWVEGDAWGWVLEKNVTWSADDEDFADHDSWEEVESCWGYLGWKYAHETAREQWACHLRDAHQQGQGSNEEKE